MPPDITAGLSALVGSPPGTAVSGKTTTTGPPAPALNGLSASLFASLLANTGKSGLARRPAPKGDLPLPVLQIKDPLPVRKLTVPVLVKQLHTQRSKIVISKTMDTLPLLASPAPEKPKVNASELLLPQNQTVTRIASSDVTGMPPALTLLASPTPGVATALPTIGVATALPVKAAVVAHASVSIAPPKGLPLPRTFAVSSTVPLPQPPARLAEPLASALPAAAGTASPTAAEIILLLAHQPPSPKQAADIAQLADPASVPAAVKVSVATPYLAGPLKAVPVSNSPAPPAAAVVDPSPTGTVVSAPALPAAIPSVQAIIDTAVPSTPIQVPVKTEGKAAPPALELEPENADNNTRNVAARNAVVLPSTAPPVVQPKSAAPVTAREANLPVAVKRNETRTASGPPEAGISQAPPASARVAENILPASKPLSAADKAEIVRQTADGLQTMPLPVKPGGTQQMSLQLHPKDWGSLQISVSVTAGQQAGAAKSVTAHIVAETPQVKAALQSQTGALHQALRASGLNLDHLTVSVKPEEPKLTVIKPSAEAASAGLSSGQGQGNSAGQPGASPAGANSAGTSLGSSQAQAGSSQNGRQQQPAPAQAGRDEPEPDQLGRQVVPLRPVTGRIDTHA